MHIIILLLLLIPSCLYAADPYWVSPTGAATWVNCQSASALSGASACPLSTALSNAVAGNTVYLRGGDYDRGIHIINNDGTAENKIIYQAHTGETPVIKNTTNAYWAGRYHGLLLYGSDYVKISGITFEYTSGGYLFFIGYGASYNEIENCIIDGKGSSVNVAIWKGNTAGGEELAAKYNWLHGNTFKDAGEVSSACNDEGGMQIGVPAYDNVSGYNTFENNTFYGNGHHNLETFTKYNVIRNNFFFFPGSMAKPEASCTYGPDSNDLYGNRNIQIYDGLDQDGMFNLLEGNRFGPSGPPPDDDGGDGMTITAPKNIIRYNEVYSAQNNGVLFKLGSDSSSDNNRFYNNTITGSGRFENDGPQWQGYDFRWYISSDVSGVGNVIKNNIFYGGVSGNITSHVYADANNTITNNHLTATGDPLFLDGSLPAITSTPTTGDPNLALATGSPAINAGTYLTQVNDADGCDADTAVCTDMVVDDALYFQDGTWGSSLSTIAPDEICISASADATDLARCRAISSINYATNTITLASEITFANNEYVWLYKKSDGTQVLIGTKPDIGAHEYNSGSVYTLTVSKLGSGTGTVTSDVTGIDCGATCEYDYDGTVVTLTATATLPNYFAGWSGTGGCTGTSTCELTMSAAKAATATFSRYGTATIGAGGAFVTGAGGSFTLQ